MLARVYLGGSIHFLIIRGGTNRENLYRVGYRVCKLRSGQGSGRVYPMRVGKTPQYFQPCLRECAKL